MLITGGSGLEKTMHCLKEQDDIDKIYLHAKDLSEPKHAFFIKRCENAGIKQLND